MGAVFIALARGLWSRVAGTVAIAGAVAVAVGVVWLRMKEAARAEYERRRAADREKAAKTAQEVSDDVANSSNADVDQRLDRWMRD